MNPDSTTHPFKPYKDPKLKITPMNTKPFYKVATEKCQYPPDRANNRQIVMAQALYRKLGDQPNAKYVFDGVTYKLGDCMVVENGYRWFFGYEYFGSEQKSVWNGLTNPYIPF